MDQAIISVLTQTYQNIELLVIDNNSKDNSKSIIEKLKNKYQFSTFYHEQNLGLPIAFNKSLKIAKGEYVIDLAADDILYPYCIEKQVNTFLNSDSDIAMLYSDAMYIDINNVELYLHSKKYNFQPSGMVFKEVIHKYFI